jgi:hypothetical protein
MDKEVIGLVATLGAMKLLLGRLFVLVYVDAKLTPEQISAAQKAMLENIPKQALIGTTDPAISDLLSAETIIWVVGFAEYGYFAGVVLGKPKVVGGT